MNQQHFLNLLGRYVNHGSINRMDVLLGYVSATAPFHRNASRLSSLHANVNSEQSAIIKKDIFLPKYAGTNSAVLRISDFLNTHVREYVKAVLLHGSLATNEEIAYSDVDALVILSDSTFNSPKRLAKAAIHLSRCYSLMLEYDPLQHHGWFAISEKDLANFPTSYLPPEILPYCCSLLDPVELNISYAESHSSASNFFKLVKSLKKQLVPGFVPANLYFAKSILSEFMMLPTLFIQYKTNSGIYKKFSFEKVRPLFSSDEWMVMDEVSEIRSKWKSGDARVPFKVPCVVSIAKKQRLKSNAPLLNDYLRNQFASGLSIRMLKFIDTIILKANETQIR